MRFTRAGAGVMVAGALCFIVGRLFGADEVLYLAAMLVGALVVSVIFTATTRLDLSIDRVATPARLRAGTPTRIDLTIANRGRRSTPVLHATDDISDTPGASLHLAPIAPGSNASIAYRLPSIRRGRIEVGPLTLRFGDPLGLTRSSLQASDRVTLVVHPALEDLGELHATAGHDPTADLQPVRALATGGDEFFALRPYVIGDELRRVHWRASARTEELVVRHDERPRTGRVTIVLDRRREVYDQEGFERAVSAAISTLYAGWRGNDALRFLTSAGPAVTDIRSRHELDAVDEELATVTMTGSASLIRSIEQLTKLGRGGTLVVITGAPTQELHMALDRARRSFGIVVPIVCQSVPDIAQGVVLHDGTAPLAQRWRSTTGELVR